MGQISKSARGYINRFRRLTKKYGQRVDELPQLLFERRNLSLQDCNRGLLLSDIERGHCAGCQLRLECLENALGALKIALGHRQLVAQFEDLKIACRDA